MPVHRHLTGEQLHRSWVWNFPTEADRLAATGFTVDDVGKDAHQFSDHSRWMLLNHDPIEWVYLYGEHTAVETTYVVLDYVEDNYVA